MKVLFTLTQPFDPNDGGVQRSTYKIGKYLFEQGYGVAYFSTDHQGHVSSEYGTLYHGSQSGGETNPKNIDSLRYAVEEFQPSVVINQMVHVPELRRALFALKKKHNFVLLGCLRNSLFNFKSVPLIRMQAMLPSWMFKLSNNPLGIMFFQVRHWYKYRKDLREVLDFHDRFILLTPPNQKELEYFVGNYRQNKLTMIPNSIPEVFTVGATKEKIILHVGRLDIPQKRSDLLLDYWENLYQQLPDWTFVIVGDGPYYDTLANDLSKRKLPRVQLEGRQKPEPYFEKATLFMMPSAYEGFPNTLIEAQSYGCVPFVINSYAALEWIVNDGKDAVLSNPFNMKQMAQQTIELVNTEGEIEKKRKAALDNAGRFTIHEVGKYWVKLLSDMQLN